MNNPFNENNQKEKYLFFKEMTEAINNWMLEKYPEFDLSLLNKMKELKYNQDKIVSLSNETCKKIKDEKNETLIFFKDELNKFLSLEYPGTASRLTNLAGDLEAQSKKMKELEKDIRNRIKIVIQSDSLCQDVYKMRDDVKILKEEWENLSKKLKKLFS